MYFICWCWLFSASFIATWTLLIFFYNSCLYFGDHDHTCSFWWKCTVIESIMSSLFIVEKKKKKLRELTVRGFIVTEWKSWDFNINLIDSKATCINLLGLPYKIPQIGWLKRNLFPHKFWRQEVKDYCL